ncbi:hypothetical protein SEPCBS119000_006060 [Sporothrix epigloea]|uniref:Carbohydrate kinase PfkB domain-containing protein n=1 Tax=Sporothrix epigloea TaxID=1892477 RepID=A0ABP0E0Y1_9PEZI
MKHLILTGACYVDTLLDVPYFPQEDDKLSATAARARRGGNCLNSIEVLLQLVDRQRQEETGNGRSDGDVDGDGDDALVKTHLISVLPARDASATAMIAQSFGAQPGGASPNLDLCLYRAGHSTPASCYIIRSAATGSRTIVSHHGLPDMETVEFEEAAERFFERHQTSAADSSLWHFEGRIPSTTLACIEYLRTRKGSDSRTRTIKTISVEVEKPGREGLRDLAAAADIVFYSRSWAENEGYSSAEACVRGEGANVPKEALIFCTWGAQGAVAYSRRWGKESIVTCPAPEVPAANIVDTVGAGDTFVAGVLYQLATNKALQKPAGDGMLSKDTIRDVLAFAVALATRKIQIDGFWGVV